MKTMGKLQRDLRWSYNNFPHYFRPSSKSIGRSVLSRPKPKAPNQLLVGNHNSSDPKQNGDQHSIRRQMDKILLSVYLALYFFIQKRLLGSKYFKNHLQALKNLKSLSGFKKLTSRIQVVCSQNASFQARENHFQADSNQNVLLRL